LDDLVVFKNSVNGWGITMGKDRISFHIVKDYPGWESLRDKLIKPFYEIYANLGLGGVPRQNSVIYLNKIRKPITEKYTDYFTIISPLQEAFGIETSFFVQRVFNKEANTLVAKLFSQPIAGSNEIDIILECGAVCISNDLIHDANWLRQAEETHSPIKDFFEAMITDKLRKEL
jgi:uncharacterized protein (TIGR04255 family)